MDDRYLFSDKILLELDNQVKVVISDKQACAIIASIANPSYHGHLDYVATFDKLKIITEKRSHG